MDNISQEFCSHIKCIATPLSSILNFCHVIQPHFNVYLLLRVVFLEILEMETKNQDELLYRVVPYIQLYIYTSKKSEINLPMPAFLYLRKLAFKFLNLAG